MGRFLLQALKFFAVVLVLYVASFFALVHLRVRGKPVVFNTNDYYKWKGGVTYAKFHEWDPNARWDALVLGSSHAYRGYDPRVFQDRGYGMFNLGSTAQTPLSTYTILEHFVDSTRTKLVIIDLYENTFDHAGIESVSDLTENMTSDEAALELCASLRDLRGLNLFTLRLMTRDDDATICTSPWAVTAS